MDVRCLSFPKIIAHRGASHFAPENTLAALRKAHAMGTQWVEFDVTLTRDGVPIIFHDATLKRTTNGQGKIVSTSYQSLLNLDAGSWFAHEFKDERIPTLKEWLECAAKLNMGINLEMKVRGTKRAKLLAKQIVQHFEHYWPADLPQPLISSFSVECLQAIHQAAPQLATGFLIAKWTRNWQRIVKRFDCVSLHIYHKYLNANRVAQIHKLGLKVCAYTVDDPQRAQRLWNMGVDAIFSNKLQDNDEEMKHENS